MVIITTGRDKLNSHPLPKIKKIVVRIFIPIMQLYKVGSSSSFPKLWDALLLVNCCGWCQPTSMSFTANKTTTHLVSPIPSVKFKLRLMGRPKLCHEGVGRQSQCKIKIPKTIITKSKKLGNGFLVPWNFWHSQSLLCLLCRYFFKKLL